MLDEFDSRAACPDFELFDGGGAESVGSGENDRCAFFFEAISELADGGGLADPVDAHDENHAGGGGGLGVETVGANGGSGQDFQDLIFEFALQRAGLLQLVLVDLLAKSLENFFGGLHADIGAEQRGFKLAQKLGIDGAVAGENLFDGRRVPCASC